MDIRIAALSLLVLCIVTGANAQGLATGDGIRAAIGGNTVRGAMDASGGFEEFYDVNGTIRGPDYTGEWLVSGDRMCFVYDGNPASCWSMRFDGTAVIWVGATGEEGTGTILPGNPGGY
jgi:hypothetical protein